MALKMFRLVLFIMFCVQHRCLSAKIRDDASITGRLAIKLIKLEERVRELEEKLERLARSRDHIQYVQGPKGDKGDSGPRGPPGQKGDPGYRGVKGRPGKDGSFLSLLPTCNAKEYLTSNGKELICLKLERGITVIPALTTKKPNVLTTSTVEPPVEGNGNTIRLPNPTISAGLVGKVDKFSENDKIQTFYADTWDLHSFVWDQNTYLGISQLSSQSFILQKWVQDQFVEKAVLSIPNARKWTSFEWQSELYIVIACNTKTSKGVKSAYSYIYKMQHDAITLFQKLETRTAFGVDSIEIGNDLFLVFAYLYGDHYGTYSDVFKWKAGKFEKDHTIPVTGTDVDAFSIGGRTFAAVVGTTSRDPYVYLLKYENGKFVTAFNIPMDSRPYGLTFVRARNDYFLAVAFYDLPQSVILKWNGEAFENHQEVASLKARDFATITVNRFGKELTYLALVNWDGKPMIYIYSEETKYFVKLQQMNSKWSRDIEFLRMPNSPHINLAVATNRETTIYKGTAT